MWGHADFVTVGNTESCCRQFTTSGMFGCCCCIAPQLEPISVCALSRLVVQFARTHNASLWKCLCMILGILVTLCESHCNFTPGSWWCGIAKRTSWSSLGELGGHVAHDSGTTPSCGRVDRGSLAGAPESRCLGAVHEAAQEFDGVGFVLHIVQRQDGNTRLPVALKAIVAQRPFCLTSAQRHFEIAEHSWPPPCLLTGDEGSRCHHGLRSPECPRQPTFESCGRRSATLWWRAGCCERVALKRVRRRKETTFPEFVQPGSRARLVVLVLKVVGPMVAGSQDNRFCSCLFRPAPGR